MIIQVNGKYSYNASRTIRVGDIVELPSPRIGDYGTFEGRVTQIGIAAAQSLINSDYAGPIKAIVGKSVPLHVEVTARNKRELLEKIRDIIEDIED